MTAVLPRNLAYGAGGLLGEIGESGGRDAPQGGMPRPGGDSLSVRDPNLQALRRTGVSTWALERWGVTISHWR